MATHVPENLAEAVMANLPPKFQRVQGHIQQYVTSYDVEGKPFKEWVGITREAFCDEHGKDALKTIQTFDKAVIVPSHTDYKELLGRCVNRYHKLEYLPKEGTIETWIILIKRVFREMEAIGWDYLTIMYRYPLQMQFVLCLISKENGTGKSTFGNALSYLFGRNVGFFGQTDLSSQFNTWIKSLVAVFEEINETTATLNKIKALSTARSATINEKYQAQMEFQPFVKLLILSNNDTSFIQANKHDIRYLVRTLKPIPEDEFDPDFDEKLKAEVPAVMHYLMTREIIHPKKSRMWFDPALLVTEGLKKVITESRSKCWKDMEELISEKLADKGDFYATPTMLADLLGRKYTLSEISNTLKDDMGMKQERQMRFKGIDELDHNGRPYLFTTPKPDKDEEKESEEAKSLPF